MSEFQNLLQEELKDPEFKKEWDDMQPEMDVIRAMINARIEQNLTQKELAKRTGIDQADISKLENGTRNPSLKLLKRLAHGMGTVSYTHLFAEPFYCSRWDGRTQSR